MAWEENWDIQNSLTCIIHLLISPQKVKQNEQKKIETQTYNEYVEDSGTEHRSCIHNYTISSVSRQNG